MEKVEKKTYSKPTILRVQLNHEQAVLSVCSTTFTNLSRTRGALWCRIMGCRKSNGGTGDNAPAS